MWYDPTHIWVVRRQTVNMARGGTVEALRYKTGSWRVRFPMVSSEFFIDIILPAAL